MNDLPKTIIRALELAEARTRTDRVEPEDRLALDYCVRNELIKIVTLHGPAPTPPARSQRSVRDLRPGDILLRDGRAFVVNNVAVMRGRGEVHVLVEGCPLWTYEFDATVTVLDGPLPNQPTWQEYVLTRAGMDALTLHRLSTSQAVENETPDGVPGIGEDGGKDDLKEPKLDERALALFIQDTTQRKTKIAERLGCNDVRSLSKKRCPKLNAAIAAHKAKIDPGSTKRGSKDADGTLEAWDDDDEA